MKNKRNSEEDILSSGIRIGDYVLYTDAYNFIVAKVYTVEDSKRLTDKSRIGTETIGDYTFHANLQQAVDRILTDNERQNLYNFEVVLKKHDEVLANLERLQELKRK